MHHSCRDWQPPISSFDHRWILSLLRSTLQKVHLRGKEAGVVTDWKHRDLHFYRGIAAAVQKNKDSELSDVELMPCS